MLTGYTVLVHVLSKVSYFQEATVAVAPVGADRVDTAGAFLTHEKKFRNYWLNIPVKIQSYGASVSTCYLQVLFN